jgi:signal transduction histidine kinase
MRTPWIVLGYVVVSALWIVASDAAVAAMLGDLTQVQWAQTLKGWAFVTATGGLMAALLIPYELRQRRTNRRLELALRLSEAVNRAPDLGTALSDGLGMVIDTTRWSVAEVWLVDRERTVVRSVARAHAAGDELRAFANAGLDMALAPGEGLPGRAWALAAPVWSPDVRVDERFTHRAEARAAGVVTGMAYPLRFDGEFVAVITLFAKEYVPEHVAHSDINLLMANDVAASIAAKRAADGLRTLNAQLERRVLERTRDLDTFARTASHDLKAPVRAIHAFARAVQADAGDALSSEVRGYVESILTAADEMTALVDGILAYSRASRDAIAVEAVPLDTVFDAVVDDLARRRPDLAASVRVARPLPSARGGITALRLIFGNLVENALTYVAPGVTPDVRISATAIGTGVRVDVLDNGIGVPEGARERIFEPFERLHAIETYPGTGVGLAIVRRAVERLGGSITVRTGPDGGSVFSVWLPERTSSDTGPCEERFGATA